MSFSISSLLDSGYSSQGSSGTQTAASADSRAGRMAAKLDSLGLSANDAASATVTLSQAAVHAADAAESVGKGVFGALEDVGHGVLDVVEMPFDVAKAAAGAVVDGVESVARQGWDLVVEGAKAVASGVESVVHEVAVDIPRAVVSEVGDVAKAVADDLSSVVGGSVQVAAASGASGVKLLTALL